MNPLSVSFWLFAITTYNHVEAKGYGGRPSPTPPRPSPTPPRPSPSFPRPSPTPPRPSPTFPRPSPPTRPSVPSAPRPSYPSVPTSPSRPSSPTFPTKPTVPKTRPTSSYETASPTTVEVLRSNSKASDDGSGGSVVGIIIALIVVALIVGLIYYCIRSRKNGSEKSTSKSNAPPAEPASWNKIKAEIKADAGRAEQTFKRPVNGAFESSYEEDGKRFTTTIHLQFIKNDSTGWSVQGTGHDADGDFEVIEGLLSPSGAVYWIEKCSAGTVITKGQFNTDFLSMQGTWEAANGVSGTYQDFQLTSVSETDGSSSDDDEAEIAVPMGQ